MSVSSIQSNGYAIIGDVVSAPAEAKLNASAWRDKEDTVTISEAGKELARQVLEARNQAAAEKTVEQRYADAAAFGGDYMAALENGLKLGATKEEQVTMCEVAIKNTFLPSLATTVTTDQGTIIGISDMESSLGGAVKLQTVQITRKDGLQLNLDVSEDMRINDLEDGGLAVHFAQSGLTRIFDATGNETQTWEQGGELKGTVGNDVLINRYSADVDAGDGDDIIINLASDVKLSGGAGNDKIINIGELKGVDIDTGSGDDAVYGNRLSGTLDLSQGSNKVFMNVLEGKTLLGDGNAELNARSFKGTLLIGNGDLAMNARSIFQADINHAEGANSKVNLNSDSVYQSTINLNGGGHVANMRSISESDVNLGNKNETNVEGNILVTNGIYGSKVFTGNGDDAVKVGIISDSHRSGLSILDTGAGNDTVSGLNAMFGGKVDTGDGDDTIYAKLSMFAGSINAGAGNDTIYINRAYNDGNIVDAGTGNNTVYRIPTEIWDGFLKDPSAYTTNKQWTEKYTGTYTQHYSYYSKFLYDLIDAGGPGTEGIATPWNQDKNK